MRSNASTTSFDELDAPYTPPASVDFSAKLSSVSNMTKLKTPTAASGRAEYVGVCLPVDVSMLYQVQYTTTYVQYYLCNLLCIYYFLPHYTTAL